MWNLNFVPSLLPSVCLKNCIFYLKCLEKDKQTIHFTASEDSHGTSPRAQHSNANETSESIFQGRCKSVKPVVSMMQWTLAASKILNVSILFDLSRKKDRSVGLK